MEAIHYQVCLVSFCGILRLQAFSLLNDLNCIPVAAPADANKAANVFVTTKAAEFVPGAVQVVARVAPSAPGPVAPAVNKMARRNGLLIFSSKL
jgi:hypothetical protein